MAHPDSTGTEVPVLGTLWDLAPCTSSYGGSFVSFILNCNRKYSAFLSSVSHSRELLNLTEESWEPLNLYLAGEKCR